MTAPPPASPSSAAALRLALLTDREQALTRLYRQTFPLVRRHVRRHGGADADAEDVFQDALVLLYEQAVSGALVLTATPGAYLLGVARHRWHHEQRRRARLAQSPLPDDPGELPPALPDPAEPAVAVRDYVEQLGEKCKQVLLAFYYFQQPLSEIAAAHGYRSVRSATVQKFKCLERLRNAVRAAFATNTVAYEHHAS